MRFPAWLWLTLTAAAYSQSFNLTTIAGGWLPDKIPATEASLHNFGFGNLAFDGKDNLYFAAMGALFRIDSAGQLTRVAGNGTIGYSGDGGPAVNAQFTGLTNGDGIDGLAFGPDGSIYLSDGGNSFLPGAGLRIRKITNGVITTIAGNGNSGQNADGTYSGDGGPATSAPLVAPGAIAVDSAGTIYFAEGSSTTAVGIRVRRIKDGVISTYAGGITSGFSGDGGLATSAKFGHIAGLALDPQGNLYISDYTNKRIRMVTPAGIVTTVVGGGSTPVGTSTVSATSVSLNAVANIAMLGDVLYVSESAPGAFGGATHKVSKGMIARYQARPFNAVDSAGITFLAVSTSNFGTEFIQKSDLQGVVTRVAGGGAGYNVGNFGPPLSAHLQSPKGVAVDRSGTVYIADSYHNMVRKIVNGTITSIAGTGSAAFSGDGGSGISATLNAPRAIAVDAAGDVFINDSRNGRVRKVSGGVITTVAGSTSLTCSGMYSAFSIALGPDGMYFADPRCHVIWRLTNGTATRVAGTGRLGSSGDGGPPLEADLEGPSGVAFGPSGALYIATRTKIRKIANGVITTIAGNGRSATDGDGGPALQAALQSTDIAVDANEAVYVSYDNSIGGPNAVRKIANGIITTVAGSGVPGYNGESGPATTIQLNQPSGMAVTADGSLLLADANNNRVRLLRPNGSGCVAVASVSGNTASVGVGGASLSIGVQASSGCSWAVDSLPFWITSTATAQVNSGNAALTFTIAPNSGPERSGVVSVANLQVVIRQEGTPQKVNVVTPIFISQAKAIPTDMAPDEIVTVWGTGLCPRSQDAVPVLPDRLGGCKVTIDGTAVPLYYASPGQINLLLPGNLSIGSHKLTVQIYADAAYTQMTAESAAFTLSTKKSSLALLDITDASGTVLAAQFQDGGFASATRPIQAGDFLTLYLTGLGQKARAVPAGTPANATNNALETVQVTVGGNAAKVAYAGSQPQYPGLDQITLQVPSYGGVAENGTVTFEITVASTGQKFSYSVNAQ